MIPKQREDVICREEDFGAIIFDPGAGRMHKLNKDGFLIWSMCDGTMDVSTIAETLSQKEGEELEDVREQVDAFLKDMDERKLIGWL
ncbi:MAG: PqqD family protein [Theionarchaea archaeon]|nr:PqqD family protein [Theionarchaea archaeon]MBU7001324.1 PqqD family protein [Theionarchaea archaeon]MBU7019815.1 PqqD family protein [Theionarchaea archaeon]MBU7035146.1 PqqD family protein [Theionarchaea archaeon]MBU7040761.1 PqqD family protein [Theionarchaea archaeon]